jgi:hypothetical protein
MIDNTIFDLERVEQAMRLHYPNTRCDYRKIATKYYQLVKQAVIKGVQMADTEAVKLNLIPVSFYQLTIKTGRYGSKGKQRYWFEWFQKNFPLMEPVIAGSNFGRNKRGQLTMIKTTKTIERLLAYHSDHELFNLHYRQYQPDSLDLVTVDLDSLAAYIVHNQDTQQYAVGGENHLSTLRYNEKSAMLILRLANYNKGQLPQIKSQSAFGRLYYRGPNLQSAGKIVRHAALGDCYQYDIEASVFTWKLDTVKLIVKTLNTEIKLPATIDYLDFKQHHRQRLAQLLFNNNSDYTVNTIKQVLTAVGFGARTTNAIGWYDQGVWTTTAIRQIIKSDHLIKQLFADTWFSEFVAEQDVMSRIIFEQVKDYAEIKNLEHLQNTTGNLSRNKTISYLYQKTEALIIDRLNQRLLAQGNQILLLCHDGFYTKHRADVVDLRYELQQIMPTGRLDEIKHTAFKYNPDSVIYEREHKQRIQQQEQQVAELFGRAVQEAHTLKIPKNQRNDEFDSGYDDGSRAYEPPEHYAYDPDQQDFYLEYDVKIADTPYEITVMTLK